MKTLNPQTFNKVKIKPSNLFQNIKIGPFSWSHIHTSSLYFLSPCTFPPHLSPFLSLPISLSLATFSILIMAFENVSSKNQQGKKKREIYDDELMQVFLREMWLNFRNLFYESVLTVYCLPSKLYGSIFFQLLKVG